MLNPDVLACACRHSSRIFLLRERERGCVCVCVHVCENKHRFEHKAGTRGSQPQEDVFWHHADRCYSSTQGPARNSGKRTRRSLEPRLKELPLCLKTDDPSTLGFPRNEVNQCFWMLPRLQAPLPFWFAKGNKGTTIICRD